MARPLRVEDRAVRTFLLAGAPEDAFPLVLVEGENGQWHDPATNNTYSRDELAGEGEPLCVLARPDAPHHYLTADYDLLAVGIREEVRGAGDVKWPPFHPDMGGITERQKETLLALNEAVETHAHYASGNVVHHGPENQYEKSDYVDYPVTVFEPDGRILVILQGPENHRDLHLKRYFARKQRSGWYVYYNEKSPGWQWEHYRPYDPIKGYDDRDAPNLPLYPDELPPPNKPKVAMAQEPESQVPMPDRPVQRAESSQEDDNAPEEASATTVRNEEQQGAASENAPAGREPGVSVQVWEPLNSRKKTEKKPKPAPAEEEGASRREPGIKVEVFDPLSSSEEETDSSGSAVEKTKPRKKSN
ncbi:MAG: hypothetical protein IT364_23090 [Candidatus Hydrogenedentes bacterium]|nr:hypothetical protein [Candidatus Hydrogenedentota bacterium]